MILASIYIGEQALSPLVEQNIASLKERHPDLPHRLFGGDDIEAFLEAFPREVLDAYRTLRPLAYKADLARYCILYEMGGIYADPSQFFVAPLPFDRVRPVVFRDMFWSSPWDTSNSVFAFPPRHKALGKAIELVCANVSQRYYGPTPLCPTGPAVFGRALAMMCAPEDLVSGQSAAHKREAVIEKCPHAPLPEGARIPCLETRNGTIIAIKQKPRDTVGLRKLGVLGSDNYVTHWKKREVY